MSKLKTAAKWGLAFKAALLMHSSMAMASAHTHHYDVVCRDAAGNVKWEESVDNIVVTTGLTDIIDKYYKGSAYTAAHYLSLKGSGSFAAGDTMASHAGWSEITDYDEAARQTIAWGTTSAGSNTATALVFTMNASVTVAGAFITTNNTKGGTTGTLIGGADFSVARSVADNDTITVTPTASATSS